MGNLLRRHFIKFTEIHGHYIILIEIQRFRIFQISIALLWNLMIIEARYRGTAVS